MAVYYNEYDKHKAAWLRHLIEEGEIAHGIVDQRSIHAVQPEDLHGFTQCHFFAGIGLWSLCLRRAGWPDDRPVWTGSCPCGPFSIAGKQEGFADPRHLWPEWLRLACQRRPRVLFGEQSDEASEWLDLVQGDLEGLGYAFGAVDIPAAGFGGAHRRQRFGFVADADNAEWWAERAPWHDGCWPKTGRVQGYRHPGDGRSSNRLGVGLADPGGPHLVGGRQLAGSLGEEGVQPGTGKRTSGLCPLGGPEGVAQGDPFASRLSDADLGIIRRPGWGPEGRATEQSGGAPGASVDWLLCRDSRWRPVESGTCPLVDASPARMGRLRGYGDGIDCETFTQLIAAYMEVAP